MAVWCMEGVAAGSGGGSGREGRRNETGVESEAEVSLKQRLIG
jgi:hypothetical protein